MKKLMVVLLVGCLALLVSSSIFATTYTSTPVYRNDGAPALPNEGSLNLSGQSEANADVGATAKLRAYVTPYAKVTFNSQKNLLNATDENYTTAASALSDAQKGLTFSGKAGETKFGSIQYTVETNCDVNVDGFGSAFKGNTAAYGDDYLTTYYRLQPKNSNVGPSTPLPDSYDWRVITDAGYVWAPEAFDHKYAPVTGSGQDDNPGTYTVFFKAKTGPEISSQRAGYYTAKYIVTVWAPTGLHQYVD